MEHAEEQALPAPVAAAEHDVGVDGAGDVEVDLDVVRGWLGEQGVECGAEVGVGG